MKTILSLDPLTVMTGDGETFETVWTFPPGTDKLDAIMRLEDEGFNPFGYSSGAGYMFAHRATFETAPDGALIVRQSGGLDV